MSDEEVAIALEQEILGEDKIALPCGCILDVAGRILIGWVYTGSTVVHCATHPRPISMAEHIYKSGALTEGPRTPMERQWITEKGEVLQGENAAFAEKMMSGMFSQMMQGLALDQMESTKALDKKFLTNLRKTCKRPKGQRRPKK